MPYRLMAKFVVFCGLALTLAGCVDAKLDVTVQTQDTANAVLTEVMSAEFYAMVATAPAKTDAKGNTELGPQPNHFCADGALTENTDGTATCLLQSQGPFAALALGRHAKLLSFSSAGPGLVRVALWTEGLQKELDAHFGRSPEAAQMNEALFSGHALTVHFGGLEVTDTNMSLSDDKSSAEQVIQFLDLIHGTANLPPVLFAVVRVK